MVNNARPLAVYDMDSLAIHFAPYFYCGQELEVIPEGKNAAARIKGVCPNSAASRYLAGRAPVWLLIATVATFYIAGPLL